LRPEVYDKYKTLSIPEVPRSSEDSFIRESGLIAQEIYYNAPELRHLVTVPEDASPVDQVTIPDDPTVDPDYSSWGTTAASVNYIGLIPYLIKAMQEQHDIIEKQQTMLDFIMSKLAA
jgi:hypothetical protein